MCKFQLSVSFTILTILCKYFRYRHHLRNANRQIPEITVTEPSPEAQDSDSPPAYQGKLLGFSSSRYCDDLAFSLALQSADVLQTRI